jgi:hypothetical protein
MPGFPKYNAGYGELFDFNSDALLASALRGATFANELPQTVSPVDCLLSPDNVPGSALFSDLTTPCLSNTSPDFSDNFDTSPMLASTDAMPDNWYPLFTDNEVVDDSFQHTTNFIDTTEEGLEDLSCSNKVTEIVEQVSPSPSILHRLSSPSGVQKNRRTGKTLDPIEVEDLDPVSAKRAKNTMAARKSRQKKRDVEEQLRIELAAMTAERDRWMHAAIARGAPPPSK